jgi:predicted RecB family nuclease
MLWFDLWLSTGNRRYLELAVQYDEDDCRATRKVRQWLTEEWLASVLWST